MRKNDFDTLEFPCSARVEQEEYTAQDAQKAVQQGRSVEPLSEARTKLTDLFSILLTQSVEGVMVSRSYICGLLLAGVLVTLGGFGVLEPLVLAAPAKSKKDAKPPVSQPIAPDRQVSIARPKVGAKQPTRTESSKIVTAASQGQTPSDRAPRKIRRHRKAGKKWRPPAIVQPKPDLSYHGILEQPQRYDPSRDRQAGRVPNPQAGEILHDHFQELDKNHDGMIDPFERAFGRLDMDRDVSNHQWE